MGNELHSKDCCNISSKLIWLSAVIRSSANRPCTKRNTTKTTTTMTTSTTSSIPIYGKQTGSNSAAWRRLSGTERKARGVLGVSRLKAHVGRSDLSSEVLFCFGFIDTSFIAVGKKKNQIKRWWAELRSFLTHNDSSFFSQSLSVWLCSVHICHVSDRLIIRRRDLQNRRMIFNFLWLIFYLYFKKNLFKK